MIEQQSRRSFLVSTTSVILGLALSQGRSQASTSPDPAIREHLLALSQLSRDERERLIVKVEDDQAALCSALVNQLTSESADIDVRLYAAYFLGQYRFVAACSPLAQWITLEDKVRPNSLASLHHQWYWGPYPAMQALINIGQPALSSVTRNLMDSADPTVRDLSLEVVMNVGLTPEVARDVLDRALASETDVQRVKRLRLAIDAIK